MITTILIIYFIYQLLRNDKVYRIRINWKLNDDYRYAYFSYESMLFPNKKNWFGLKYPEDNHFVYEK